MKTLTNKTAIEINDIPSFGVELKHVDVGGTLFKMKTKTCGIYKITSPTGGVYIGQSKNIYNRYYGYKALCCEQQPRLYNSFLKYGFDSHKFEIIHECLPEELNKWEVHYIKLYDTFNTKHGMNLTSGGDSSSKISEETRNKIKENMTGEKNHRFGKKASEETREKMRNSAKGKIKSPEHIKNVTESLAKIRKEGIVKMGTTGMKFGEESSKRRSIALKNSEKHKNGLKKHYKPICQISLDGFFITEYESRKDAILATGVSGSGIWSCINGIQKKAGGYIWI